MRQPSTALVMRALAVPGLFAGIALAQTATPTARIEGSVTDLAGRGVAQAQVRLVRTADETVVAELTTDGSGAFLWPRAPRAEYSVRASAPGHVAMTTAPTWNAVRTLGLCRLRLPDARTIGGRVRDERGQPLRARVKVYDRTLETTQDEPETTSDADGAFTLTGAPLGPLRLVAHAPAHGVQILDLPLGDDAAQDVVLRRDAGVTLVLQLAGAPANELAGGVCYFFAYDDTGLVALPDGVRRGHADADGRWIVHGLPSSLRYKSFGAFVPGFTPLVADHQAAPPFAEGRIERTLTLSRAAEIELRGQVLDEQGRPLANAPLSLETAEGHRHLTTDGDGRWQTTAREMFGGYWPLRAEPDGWVLDPRPEDRPRLPFRATFRILRSDRDLVLTARPATCIRGQAVTSGGAPAAGALVELVPSQPEANGVVVASALTDAAGNFAFAGEHEAALEHLRVQVRLQDEVGAVDVAPAGERPGDDRVLRVPSLRLQPSVLWTGTLRDAGADGAPLGGAIVVLERRDGDWCSFATEVCARDGSFRFEARRFGEWRVVARLDTRAIASAPVTADGSAITFPLRMPR